MSKKVIIISVASVILIAGAVFGALYFIKKSSTPSEQAPVAEAKTTPDLSVNFGACDLLNKETIKTALGAVAKDLQGPGDMGRAFLKGGDQSQVCVYSFVGDANFDNNFNQTNSFNVEVFVHASQSSIDTLKTAVSDGKTVVTGIGDGAVYYSRADQAVTYQSFTLIVYSGLKHYTYNISIPKSDTRLNADSARTALESIAKSVTYK